LSTSDWEEINSVEGLPEELVIQILGNRRPVLFVEGENGSYDVELFRLLYPNHLVIPRGSCTQVIALTKAFKSQSQFHHLDIRGIVDRDRRTDSEVKALKDDGIHVLDVAEVENLLCVPEVLELVAKQLVLDDKVPKAKEFILKCLKDELDNQIALRAANEVKFQLSSLDDKSRTEKELNEAVERLVQSVDIPKIYSTVKAEFDAVISANDPVGVLKLYNRKSLASRVGAVFGLKEKENELIELVLRMAKSKDGESVRDAFKKYVPQL
jgi:histidyl-tRNA synthetase